MKLRKLLDLGVALLVLLPLGAYLYQQGEASRAYGRMMETRRQEEKAALAAIRQASPDPLARLKERGGSITAEASLQGSTLLLDYQFSAGGMAHQVIPLYIPGELIPPRLYDPATGKELGRMTQNGHSTSPDGPTRGQASFEGISALPDRAELEMPHLGVYMKPGRELRWEVRRPGEAGEVPVGERFTVAGVEFEVERVRFDQHKVHIDYRQLTEPARVGFHLLTFGLSDRMGGKWGGDYPLERLPDPNRPGQSFDLLPNLSHTWTVQVQYAVLLLPGPAIPVEVK